MPERPRRTTRLIGPGDPLPAVSLDLLDGGTRSLAEQQPMLLAFFKVSCPTCQLAFPYLERLSKGSLPVVGVSQDADAATRSFNQRFGVTFPVLLDREERQYPASNAIGLTNVPTLILVEADGRVASAGSGFSRADLAALGERAGVEVFRPNEQVPAFKPG